MIHSLWTGEIGYGESESAWRIMVSMCFFVQGYHIERMSGLRFGRSCDGVFREIVRVHVAVCADGSTSSA